MKRIIAAAAISVLLASAGSAALAEGRGDHWDHANHGGRGDQGDHGDNGRHAGWGQDRGEGHHWRRGERMGYNDWQGSQVVDYRQHHLRHPPRGYEWRESNGRYVLAAVATGLIASIILNSQ